MKVEVEELYNWYPSAFPTESLDNYTEVQVNPGPLDVKGKQKQCIDNAINFKEQYGLDIVKGFLVHNNAPYGFVLIDHVWNVDDEGNYYDSTPIDTQHKWHGGYYVDKFELIS